jgi:hypothetical protein
MIELPIKAGMIKPDEILPTEEAKVRIEKRKLQISVEEAVEAMQRQQERDAEVFRRTGGLFNARMGNVNTANTSWTASFNFGASGR